VQRTALENHVVGANQLNPPLSHSIAFTFTFAFIFTLSIHTRNHGIYLHVHMRSAHIHVFLCMQLQPLSGHVMTPSVSCIPRLSVFTCMHSHTHMFVCEFTHIEHSLTRSTCHAHAHLKPFSQPFTSPMNHHFNASSISKRCPAPAFNDIVCVDECATSLFAQPPHICQTSLLFNLSLTVEGFYRHGMGFCVDVGVTIFTFLLISFPIIILHCHTTGGPVFRLCSASPANVDMRTMSIRSESNQIKHHKTR
jgi:hypothetical protein